MTAHPIAILGATSRIATDFVLSCGRSRDFALYARDPDRVAAFLNSHNLPLAWNRGPIDTLAEHAIGGEHFAGIINCVGVGDPAKALAMGADIFQATLLSDSVAIRAASAHPCTPYVYLSSGAVYGSGFKAPATEATNTVLPINDLDPQSFYAIAKCQAEAMHRSRRDLTIVDLRVFSYVSRRIDLDARFIVMDMVRAIRTGTDFVTTTSEMHRDFLHPEGMKDLLLACLAVPAGTNRPIDAYSLAPISKSDLIDLMVTRFGMRVHYRDVADIVAATGDKPFYYSEFRAAEEIGFAPRWTSREAIAVEVEAMLQAAG